MLEKTRESRTDRRQFIGGSDARIIMGQDEKALIRLWKEKRGEIGPEDLSTNLIVEKGNLGERQGQTEPRGVPPFTPSCVYETERRRRRRFRQ